MKKIIGLILVFVLLFAVASEAFAGGKPQITQHPESATVKKGGKVSFSVKTKGTVSTYVWYFINPATGEQYTGRQLSGAVKGVKVEKPNSKTITLKNVPESMHGWKVYVHVNGNGYKIDSEQATLLIAGMDNPEASPSEKTADAPAKEPAKDASAKTPALISVEFLKQSANLKENVEIVAVTSPDVVKLTMFTDNKAVKSWTDGYTDDGNTRTWKATYAFSGAGDRTLDFVAYDAGDTPSDAKSASIKITKAAESSAEETAAVDEGPKTFTVKATSKILRQLDDTGNVTDDAPVSSLEITGIGYVLVTSEEPIISWTLNGIRVQPAEPVNEFRVLNVTSDLSIDVKTARTSAADAVVDETRMCKVTCTGCTFSYSRGGLRSVTEGEVPAGAPINIIADSSDLAKNGYSVNGGDPENKGKASFKLTVSEDVNIVCK